MAQQGCRLVIILGGTNLRVGRFDSNMHLLGERSMLIRTSNGPDAVVAELAAAVTDLLINKALTDFLK